MQFIIIARDGTDTDAPQRRQKARDEHLRLCQKGIAEGHNLIAAAMLNEAAQMNGSIMIVDYPSRDDLDEWLKNEPYIRDGVWQNIEIIPCKIPPFFTEKKEAA